jgi:hypothetical protein
MENFKFAFLVFILLLVAPRIGESAGVFGGTEVDDEGQRFFYIGMITEGKLFFNIFAGDLLYEFEINGDFREARLRFITPALGIKKEGPLTFTLIAGPTLREKKEEQDSGFKTKTEAGGFFQFGGFIWGKDENLEVLISYTTLDNFFWSRLRGKKRIIGHIFTGIGLFWMGNRDFEGWGVGPLLEFRGEKGTLGVKAGYKYTSTYKGGVYTGVEFYISF